MSASVLFDAPGPKARRRHMMLTVVGVLLFLVGMFLVYKRLDDKGQFASALWKPLTTGTVWQSLLEGLVGTLKAAAIAIVIAGVLGVLFALGRMSEIAPLRWICSVLVEIFRAVPVLLMMLFTYGYLSTSGAVDDELAPLYATVTGLVLYNSSVVAEVIRSGVDQLPNGQREAGLSIGLRANQTLRMIQLPQAITAMLPALISQLVVVLKDTALGYNVLYSELLRTGQGIGSNNANIVQMMFVLGVIYILINYSLSKLAEFVERRLKNRGRGSRKQQVTGGPVVAADAAA
ncbi:amino acid ABC transporter permease [Yimella sp. NH-Cas1]|uniref:amino acid ABC transporter permease n=1 Tax=Yimella sp. NH-Cas1 TaxID=2917726 RepID=UPI001EFB0056|nr:amino acid ABC transporter permease [Yimella sp. NH-Cas1]MCG8656453.1 amino acid ABC transporter permease [Yimella sp. NH-Cas1]